MWNVDLNVPTNFVCIVFKSAVKKYFGRLKI